MFVGWSWLEGRCWKILLRGSPFGGGIEPPLRRRRPLEEPRPLPTRRKQLLLLGARAAEVWARRSTRRRLSSAASEDPVPSAAASPRQFYSSGRGLRDVQVFGSASGSPELGWDAPAAGATMADVGISGLWYPTRKGFAASRVFFARAL